MLKGCGKGDGHEGEENGLFTLEQREVTEKKQYAEDTIAVFRAKVRCCGRALPRSTVRATVL